MVKVHLVRGPHLLSGSHFTETVQQADMNAHPSAHMQPDRETAKNRGLSFAKEVSRKGIQSQDVIAGYSKWSATYDQVKPTSLLKTLVSQ